jgi:hypothetical protein
MLEFKNRVAGIPCIIRILHAEPFRAGFFRGPPENCYPDEGGLIVWEVCDQRGRSAPWLERKLTKQDMARIDKDAWAALEAEAQEARDDYLINQYEAAQR